MTLEQESFLDEVIEGLSQDDKVICVRLALFGHVPREGMEPQGVEGGRRDRGHRSYFPGGNVQSTPQPQKSTANIRTGRSRSLRLSCREEGAEIKVRNAPPQS